MSTKVIKRYEVIALYLNKKHPELKIQGVLYLYTIVYTV